MPIFIFISRLIFLPVVSLFISFSYSKPTNMQWFYYLCWISFSIFQFETHSFIIASFYFPPLLFMIIFACAFQKLLTVYLIFIISHPLIFFNLTFYFIILTAHIPS
jgi:hypothetical protein